MRKNNRIFIGRALAILALFSGFSACTAQKDEEAVIPEGYTKESAAGNMFWEQSDVLDENGQVVANADLAIYNYCPSIFREDENTRYAYYCSNRETRGKGAGDVYVDSLGNDRVTDYIAMRKGVKIKDEWFWSPKKYVLSPLKRQNVSESDTEGQQVCDPNVIKGEFTYDGESFGYLMAYLACNTRNNEYNHVCLAVAKTAEGPWKRCDKINPLLKYTSDNVPAELRSTYQWGYGQASMISVDKKGRILMFYSTIAPICDENNRWRHATVTSVAGYDFSDLNQITREFFVQQMNCGGILRLGANSKTSAPTAVPTVTNGDYAYDPVGGYIYGITDGEYNERFAMSAAPVFRIKNQSKSGTAEIGSVFKDYAASTWSEEKISWETVGQISCKVGETYKGVHNTCVVRDGYGYLTASDRLEVVVTESDVNKKYESSGKKEDPLWTYRLKRVTIKI